VKHQWLDRRSVGPYRLCVLCVVIIGRGRTTSSKYGLWCCVVCVILCLAVLVQCRLVTDRQTDGQTLNDSIYRASIALRGKIFSLLKIRGRATGSPLGSADVICRTSTCRTSEPSPYAAYTSTLVTTLQVGVSSLFR